ncbi:hypothetical protein GRJ22_08960 [Photobacterium carnosum]|uniref:hypothetical protein n=1 Tax=Photobacterium carnosum TaxID=2023717 RepID=UPI001E293279|nr:hypothetical protein [Photobacterium carnosum]MCD9556567.1 hypothetical protein [Photobacterium carnosum]
MKKSEIKYDLDRIIERLNIIKSEKSINNNHIENIIDDISELRSSLSIGYQPSIMKRESLCLQKKPIDTQQKCRFCGKP